MIKDLSFKMFTTCTWPRNIEKSEVKGMRKLYRHLIFIWSPSRVLGLGEGEEITGVIKKNEGHPNST